MHAVGHVVGGQGAEDGVLDECPGRHVLECLRTYIHIQNATFLIGYIHTVRVRVHTSKISYTPDNFTYIHTYIHTYYQAS